MENSHRARHVFQSRRDHSIIVACRYSDIYTCSKGGNCAMTIKTRKNCQYCRFKKCESSGMKRSWVLADGEKRGGR